MFNKLEQLIKENNLNIYDVAIMTENGVREAYFQPCNFCNASYSVTKLFVVTMIGILVDSHLLRLDNCIMEILVEDVNSFYDSIWDKVTIQHALTHKMGIEFGVIDIDRDDTGKYQEENYLSAILKHSPVYEPGTYRQYTDIPHYLLSLVIEKITGKTADEMITERILNPMHFANTAWARCPMNHTIGASGAYMRAKDMVKLAWLYQNYGNYQGNQIISRDWVEKVQYEQYDLYPLENSDFWGKAGMNGQMTMYNRKRNISVAWHGYMENELNNPLMIQFFQNNYNI